MDLFFVVSKIAWFVVQPLNLAALAVAAATWRAWRGSLRGARRWITLSLLLLLAPALLPLDRWLLAPLETRVAAPDPLPGRVDGIVLLGGAQRPVLTAYHRQPELNAAAETLTTFLALARRYPQAKLVFSGGSGDILHQELSEVQTVKLFLQEQGFEEARVTYEGKSRNTYENALYSKELVQPRPDETWLVICVARSAPRTLGIFRKLAWNVILVPRDHLVVPPSEGWLSLALLGAHDNLARGVREWIGLIAYRLAGRIDSWFPRP